MDPLHYDRISDLLCQIRAKIDNNLRPNTKEGQLWKEDYIRRVLELLVITDDTANKDQKGML